MRAACVLLQAALASAAWFKDWEPGSCDLKDAEAYLASFGVITGLPKLDVRFGHFATQEFPVHGAETTFAQGKEELNQPPRVKWEQDGKFTDAKYMVLMLDADADTPDSSGEKSSEPKRPTVHWMVVNAKKTASNGQVVFRYVPAGAEQAGGLHRYIVILLLQTAPGHLADFMPKHRNWDLLGFFQRNQEALKPIAYNFFYVDSDLSPEDEALAQARALGMGDDEDDFPYPVKDAKKGAKKDEL